MRLIDAEAFSEQYGNYYAEQGTAEGFIGTVGELIAEVPAVDAEPVRHGHWIDKYKSSRGTQSWCSVCEKRSGIGGIESNRHRAYCPNCGAKMDLRTPTEVQLDEADSVMMGEVRQDATD